MRFPEIAKALEGRIRRGEYVAGRILPSETALAAEFGVARGTVRRALEEVEQRQQAVSRRGVRWLVVDVRRPRRYDGVRPFVMWALAAGYEPSARTVDMERVQATGPETQALGLPHQSRVVRIVRSVELDGRPVGVLRATFPLWLADLVQSAPPDTRSVVDHVVKRGGVEPGTAESRISAGPADTRDAQLLGVPRTAPLIQVHRTARSADGQPYEHSEGRFHPDEVTVTLT
ncbi:GntR family transcriptional regulator [Nocardioides sp. W7]|uniref:GntR family transcriptional regulator n=1 Tax=Nocardioides sp. W7 TaxID=2931390 RepID=UPI001FD1082F|nr:GntR family transcriptional regulator [Nocardioides sp. W7]